MKKLFFSIGLVFMGAIGAQAQGFSIGARGGLNFANETASGSGASISYDTRTSFLLGGYATFMLSDKIGLQPELFYSSIGAKSGSNVEKLNYFSIPVLFRYNVTSNVHFLAGPQVSILASAKSVSGGTTIDIKDQLNGSDISGTFGVGVDFGPFNAGLRYCLGLSNIAKGAPSGSSLKNNVFQIVVGFKLFGS